MNEAGISDDLQLADAGLSMNTDELRTMLAATRRELGDVRRERDVLTEAHRHGRERERLLSDALQHRLRNLLALIRSIIRRTLETGGSQDDAVEHLDGRVAAIARYQRMTPDGAPCPVELEDILRDELLPTHCLDQPGLTLSGPSVRIEGDALVPLALAVHELVTNSLKFGALPLEGGAVNVAWSVTGEPSRGTLHLNWVEKGVAVLGSAPRLRDFGQQFIEDGLTYQLGATTSFELQPGGLVCSIAMPLGHDGAELADISLQDR